MSKPKNKFNPARYGDYTSLVKGARRRARRESTSARERIWAALPDDCFFPGASFEASILGDNSIPKKTYCPSVADLPIMCRLLGLFPHRHGSRITMIPSAGMYMDLPTPATRLTVKTPSPSSFGYNIGAEDEAQHKAHHITSELFPALFGAPERHLHIEANSQSLSFPYRLDTQVFTPDTGSFSDDGRIVLPESERIVTLEYKTDKSKPWSKLWKRQLFMPIMSAKQQHPSAQVLGLIVIARSKLFRGTDLAPASLVDCYLVDAPSDDIIDTSIIAATRVTITSGPAHTRHSDYFQAPRPKRSSLLPSIDSLLAAHS